MGKDRARVETLIGRAHRALWTAAQYCELDTSLEGAGDDLRAITIELERIQLALLRNGPTKRMVTPTSLT
jgi:Ni,Fe-hydrogenase III large subunit